MKQLLLRIPDELHARLSSRAQANNESANALATELLSIGLVKDEIGERSRTRMLARSLGILEHDGTLDLRATPDQGMTAEWQAVLNQWRGAGPTIDEILDDERGRY